jgi:hypothetical protein
MEKVLMRRIGQQVTKVLLQAGQDVVIFGCGSLSASVWAGRALLGFCLLSWVNGQKWWSKSLKA